MNLQSTKIIIEEYAGFDRVNEPVTMGMPFPCGLIRDTSALTITDPENGLIPLQTQIIATWPDDSAKWVLLDFQVSVNCTKKKVRKP